jgi:hypothetical protein
MKQISKYADEYNFDVNCHTEFGYTGMHAAAYHGHLKVVEVLLAAKAACHPLTTVGVSPLYLASGEGHEKIVERLLEAKANDRSGVKSFLQSVGGDAGKMRTPLAMAEGCGREKCVDVFKIMCPEVDLKMKVERGDSAVEEDGDKTSEAASGTSGGGGSQGGDGKPAMRASKKFAMRPPGS